MGSDFSFDESASSVQRVLRDLNSRVKMGAYLWKELPMAAFAGVRIGKVTPDFGEVILPFGWRSKNPFRSIYFAAQCAAAELSTGVLVLVAKAGAPPLSMLVTDFRAQFLKKAAGTLTFRCDQGPEIIEAVEEAVRTGLGVTVDARARGILPDGEVASEMTVTWSFKLRSKVSGHGPKVNG